jgi:hypothetical protein
MLKTVVLVILPITMTSPSIDGKAIVNTAYHGIHRIDHRCREAHPLGSEKGISAQVGRGYL